VPPALETILRQRPFVPLAALFIGGILVSRAFSLDPSVGATLVGCTVLLFLLPPFRWVAAGLLALVLGASLYSARYAILFEKDLRLLLEDKPALVTLRGKLLESPSLKEFQGRTNPVEYSYARIEVSEIHFENHWLPAAGVVASTTRGVLDPEIFKSRSVEVLGVIGRPKKAEAPGLFDYREYLFNSRIFYQLKCESTNDWRLASFEPLPLTERFQRWARHQLARGLPAQDEPLEMVWTMTLGWKQALSGEIAEVFMRTGTLHIFAISGLHVACIAGILLGISQFLGFSRRTCGLFIIPLIWFYTLATGWQSSAIRSALMSSVVIAGWALKRPTDLLNSTAAAAVLLLLFEPEQLFQASFQLSFAVVASIAVFLPAMERFRLRMLAPDPLLPNQLQSGWRVHLHPLVAFLTTNLAVSLAAWLGALPITAIYFNMITPISLLANLIAVPLSSLALGATLGSLLIPPLGPIFNYLSWAAMWETIEFTRWCAKFPFGYWYIAKPGFLFVVLYLVILSMVTLPSLRSEKLRKFSCSLLVLCALCWGGARFSSAQQIKITILPAAGSPLFVDAPGSSRDLLVDASNARGAEYLVRRFLRSQGVGRLRHVLLTHGDINHVGGVPRLLRDFSPGAVIAGDTDARSRPYRDLVARLAKIPNLLRRVSAGDLLLDWKVLHPAAGRGFARADDNAVVLNSDLHGWKVLLLSDLGAAGLKALLEREKELKSDIVVSSNSNLEQGEVESLLSLFHAKLFVVCGESFRSPKKPLMRKPPATSASGLTIRTAQEGAVTLKLSPSECLVTTMEGKSFRLERD